MLGDNHASGPGSYHNACYNALEFLCRSVNLYSKENERIRDMTEVIHRLLPGNNLSDQVAESGRLGFHLATATCTDSAQAYPLIVECQNEMGEGGCDPSLLASLSYQRYWVRDNGEYTDSP